MGWAFISNNNNRHPMVFSALPTLRNTHVESLSLFFCNFATWHVFWLSISEKNVAASP